MNKIDELYKYLPSDNQNIDWPLIKNEILKPFILSLSQTKQDNIWHAEGDVLTHTIMVCEELIKLPEYQLLPKLKKLELFIACLFHDLGKTICTKAEDGKLVSPNHGRIGSMIVREYFFKKLRISGLKEYQTFRETICLLIKYHSNPVYLGIDNDERKIIKLSLLGTLAEDFNLFMLSILSKADVIGRIGPQKDEKLESIELTIDLAKRLNCLDKPFVFENDYTKYQYLNKTSMWPYQSLYDNTWGDIILICGLPGTGKDTYITTHFPTIPVISLDVIREKLKINPTDNQGEVYNTAKAQAKEYLRKKIPFIWNATNLTNLIRGKQIKLFHDYNAKVKIIFLEASWEDTLKRNKSRKRQVIESIIEKMLQTLTLPEVDEAESIEWKCI